jgi:N-glycosidase YbiA
MKVNSESDTVSDDLDIILPPWIAFPDIDPMDMFWRMGQGEDYLESFFKFYEKLSDKGSFRAKFPDKNKWKGFYDD